jgi:hypothetical protein
MPNVEIDEVELLRLRKQDQTVHALMANPKAKRKVLEAYKEHDPNAKIPELEMEEAARKPVEELSKTVEELRKQLSDDKAERDKQAKLSELTGSVEAGIGKLRRAGWTDEGITEVRKLMDERGIIDPEIAAAYYEKQHPPQAPATPSGVGGWNFVENVQDGEADLKKLLDSKGNNEALADKMARDALQEMRGATRR